MKLSFLKYALAFVLPLFVAVSFSSEGWMSFLPLIYAFGLIPLSELWFAPSEKNLRAAEAELAREDKGYDFLLYITLPVQYGFLLWFLMGIDEVQPFGWSFWGRSIAMGLMCGVLGINVAHELGHRKQKGARYTAKALLLSTLYPHFYIEHNFGHHKHVSTPQDPATSRYNESLYAFWFRSISGSYRSAWRIQLQLLQRRKQSFFSLQNDMLWYLTLSIILVLSIAVFVGEIALLAFLVAATIGILLLETVNYIEHYGLLRNKVNEQRYEAATPMHSWNSNHIIGRMVLFELSRHSDHHANPHKAYPLLNSHAESPQMPTGYPGMMLLSAIPPLWYVVMNKRVQKVLA